MMALVNQVAKKVVMSRREITKFQILTYCYLNGIKVSEADLEFLTVLGLKEETDLSEFCSYVSERKIFKSSQSARNAVTKATKKGLIYKSGRNKKTTIGLNPDMQVQAAGNILLDYKFAHIEPKETVEANEANS
jgi:hypothetical protein